MTDSSETPKIEILQINDRKDLEEDVLITPNERMVVDKVIEIWKQDPATEILGVAKLHALVKKNEPNWSLSEKRMKSLLKKYNLLSNQPKVTYVSEIESSLTPKLELPDKIKQIMTKKSGKGLYAVYPITKGTLLWQEKPFVFVPPLDHLYLMKIGKACAHCGKLLQHNNVLLDFTCKHCEMLWCSSSCKKTDTLHNVINHNSSVKNKKMSIDSKKWALYKDFCFQNKWNAAFAVALIRFHELCDPSGLVAQQFASFARVSQKTRHKALDDALFVKEQQELLWQQGHTMFNEIFVKDSDKLSFDDYLIYLGTYNINNIESLYLIQSHLNHNCDKNVEVKVEGNSKRLCDGIRVYAAKDIKANEELVTCYVNPIHNVNQRRRELRVNWGFICNCNRCKLEEKESHRIQSSSDEKKEQVIAAATAEKKSHQRKPSSSSILSRKSIKDMLEEAVEEGEFEIVTAENMIPGRRKSVRFDEKVVAVKE